MDQFTYNIGFTNATVIIINRKKAKNKLNVAYLLQFGHNTIITEKL